MTIRNLEGAAAIGYAVGQAHGKFQSVATRLLPLIDSTTGALSADNEAAVKQGLSIYRQDTDKGEVYVQEGPDAYTRNDSPDKGAKVLHLTAAYACGFTGQEFGKLKGEQPNLHMLVGAKRKAVATYVSNAYRAAIAAVKAGKAGDRGPRGATMDWLVKLEGIFADRVKAAKVARKRGDVTVPDSDAKITAAFAACLKSLA
jgi:hypothetical protein